MIWESIPTGNRSVTSPSLSLPLLQSMCQSGFPNVPDPGARAIFFAGSSPPHLSSLLWSSLKDERKMAKSPQKSLQEYSEFFSDNFQLQQPPSFLSLPPSVPLSHQSVGRLSLIATSDLELLFSSKPKCFGQMQHAEALLLGGYRMQKD